MMEPIDARGLSCPQPVIMTRQALLAGDRGDVQVLVDTMTQVHNCSRAAGKLGWDVAVEERENFFLLTFQK